MDAAAGAPRVEHDPVEDCGRGGGGHVLVNLWKGVGRRLHELGHRVESIRYGLDDLRRRVEHLGLDGVGRRAWLRDLRQEVLRVGRVLPVAEEVRDIAVVPVVGRLRREEDAGQEAHGQKEQSARLGHHCEGRRRVMVGCWRRQEVW